MRRSGVFAGVVLILLGLLFLGATLGVLPPVTWSLVFPLLIVALGLWMIFSAFSRPSAPSAQAFSVPLGGARAARIVVRHGAGRLDLAGGAQPATLVEGEGRVALRETRSTDTVTAELTPPDWARWPEGGLDWRLRLTEQVPLALQLQVGASDNRVDLSALPVTEFELETGASSTFVRLPARGTCRANVRGGAASIRLEVPPNVAARVTVRGALANTDVAPRFVRTGDVWESPGFATAPDRVEITAEMGVGELRVL